jgi:methyl-accepting chemotaxis protein
MKVLNRVGLFIKISIIGNVMLLPAIIAVVFLLRSTWEQTHLTRNQIAGAALLVTAGDVTDGLVRHQIAVLGTLHGIPQLAGGLDAASSRVERDLKKLEADLAALDPALTAEATPQLIAFRALWESLRTGATAMQETERNEAYMFNVGVLELFRKAVIEDTGLDLLAAPDVAALTNISNLEVPELFKSGAGMQAAVGIMHGAGVNDRTASGEALVATRGIAARIDDIDSNIRVAEGANASLAGKLTASLAALRAANEALLARQAEVVASGQMTAASEFALLDGVQQLMAAGQPLQDKSSEIAAMRLAEIEADLRREAALLLGGIAICVVFGVALNWYISRNTTRQMADAVAVLQAIARGKLDSTITVAGTDEVNTLLRELAGMQRLLGDRLTTERAVASENARVRQALDSSASAVMLTDPDGNILFVNRSATKLFSGIESDLRKDLPQFDAAKLVGANFDVFHRNASHQRNLLASLTTTHSARINVGGRVMSMMAYPVSDEAGQRLGYGLEWTDFTQEAAVEREVEQVIAAASAGQLGNRVRLEDKAGFALAVSRNLNSLLEATEHVVGDLQRVLAALASGRLTETVTARYHGSYGALAGDANKTVEKLVEVVQQIQLSADLVNSGAMQISRGNEDLSQRTTEQAASLEETAASIEEFTSTVKQNADNAAQANQVAAATRSLAEKGGEVVGRAVGAMSEINQSSRRIADIIGVIDGIAFQTNLLALNAAVEAARAGEQGRGFAVVASEVRSLAGRSADAAREIKKLIQDSVAKADNGSQLVDESGRTLGEIVASVKRMSDLIAEISAASREQATGVEEVNRAVMQMDQVTTQNATLVDEASSSAHALSGQATTLSELVAFFELGNAQERRSAARHAPEAAPATGERELRSGRTPS